MSNSLPQPGYYYKIIANHSKKVVSIEALSLESGAHFHQWEDKNLENQFFAFAQVGSKEEGTFRIINKLSSKVLGITNANDLKVRQAEVSDSLLQIWKVEPTSDGYVKIILLDVRDKAEFVMTVENNSTINGDDIIVQPWNGNRHQKFKLEKVESLTVSITKGPTSNIKILGIEGGVFSFGIGEKKPHDVQELVEYHNEKTGDSLLAIWDHDKLGELKDEGFYSVPRRQRLWVYPPEQGGMVPLHYYFDKDTNNHIYTTNTLERKELDQTENVEYKGVVCSLLPLALEGDNVVPVLRIHDTKSNNTRYIFSQDEIEQTLEQASKDGQAALESSELKVGAVLHQALGDQFGSEGEAIGNALKHFDLKVEEYSDVTEEVDPYWSSLLRKRGGVKQDVLDKFKKTTKIYTLECSMINIANPDRPRIKSIIQLKIFATDQGPGFQLKFTLAGEYCLDDAIPKELRKQQSIPVIGPFLVKDLTFIFSSAKTMYDPDLDAGIERGINLYANINFDPTPGKPPRPKIMEAITKATGVKSCAFHLGLGISTVGIPKVGLIAEMALQWQRYNIAPVLESPERAQRNTKKEIPVKPPEGFAFPCIETDHFAVRFTRSDFKISGELSPTKGATVELGISSDLAVEINKLEDLGIPDTRLVFTGGVSIGAGVEVIDGPEIDLGFAFTMNGTGRNTIGELTGNTLEGDQAQYNTTELRIGNPPDIILRQAAVELGISLKQVDGFPIGTPQKFGIMAKGKFQDIEGEVAFKINLDTPSDMKAFILVAKFNKITFVDFLLLASNLWGTMLKKNAYEELFPKKWQNKVEKVLNFSIKDALIYFVPVKNTIGGVVYEDTGYVVAGTADLYGWKTSLYGVYDQKAGVALAGKMDNVNLKVGQHKIFSLSAGKSKDTSSRDSLKREKLKGDGPYMSCTLMKPGLARKAEIEVEVNAEMYFLSLKTSVLMTLRDERFHSKIDMKYCGVNGMLEISFRPNGGGISISAQGEITALNTKLPSIKTSLGTVNFGDLDFSASVNIKASQGKTSAVCSFEIKVQFLYHNDLIHIDGDFKIILNETANIKDINKYIINGVEQHAEGLAKRLFEEGKDWLGAVKEKIIDVAAEEAKGILNDTYNLGKDGAEAAMKGLGYAKDEVLDFVKDIFD
jgi:hypothetical protein